LIQQPGSRGPAYPRNAGISVCSVAHQRQEVGNLHRHHPELLANSFRIEYSLPSAVDLHHPVSPNALSQILVGSPDADPLHAGVSGGNMGCGGKSIVSLQLDHGPYRHAHGGQCFFQRVELGEEGGLDPLAGLVARPKIVTEGLDDVVSGHPDVGCPGLDHLQHGVQDPDYGAKGRILSFMETTKPVEVAKQLVGSV
jgi:hypothetical protein